MTRSRLAPASRFALARSHTHTVATNGFAVMARCEGYGPDVRSTDWVHAGDIGRLCSQWNIDYCLLDNDDRNGEYAVVWDDLGRQASIQFNEEGFDSL